MLNKYNLINITYDAENGDDGMQHTIHPEIDPRRLSQVSFVRSSSVSSQDPLDSGRSSIVEERSGHKSGQICKLTLEYHTGCFSAKLDLRKAAPQVQSLKFQFNLSQPRN